MCGTRFLLPRALSYSLKESKHGSESGLARVPAFWIVRKEESARRVLSFHAGSDAGFFLLDHASPVVAFIGEHVPFGTGIVLPVLPLFGCRQSLFIEVGDILGAAFARADRGPDDLLTFVE